MGSCLNKKKDVIIKCLNFTNEKFIFKKKVKKSEIIINPLSLQLKIKINYEYVQNNNSSYPPEINIIHQLKNNKIGILFDQEYISIYSSITFKFIYKLEPKEEKLIEIIGKYYFNLIDFLELKNDDLFLWTSRFIIIYKKLKKGYQFLQIINENEQQCEQEMTKFVKDRFKNKEILDYNLNSIHELKNGFIVSCNTYGLKFYNKKYDKYIWIKKDKIELEVENLIEIKENVLVLLLKEIKDISSRCLISRSHTSINYYKIYLYNIKNNDKNY